MNAPSPLLEAALALAEEGIRVFPLAARRKTPATKHGLKDATTDPDQIRRWWAAMPSANVGAATGDPFDALDIDGPEGEATLSRLVDRFGPLPETTEQRTGRGRQVFFAADPRLRNSAGRIGLGIDVRAAGGYVVAAPSIHPTGARYTWTRRAGFAPWPEWLLEAQLRETQESKPALPPPPPSRASRRYGAAALDSAAARVASAPEGTRNSTLNGEAHSVAQLVAGGELESTEAEAVLLEAARSAGLPDAEARRTLDSAFRAGKAKPRRAPEPANVVRMKDPEPAAVTRVEWLEPPTETGRITLPDDALHGLAGRIVRTLAPSTEADPFGILGAFLVLFGVSVGRGPHCRVGGDRHAANLFLTLVGPTSEGRKGTAVGEARRLFRLAGPEVDPPSASGLSSGEGFVFAVRDEVRVIRPVREKGRVVDHEEVVEDPGVRDKRLAVIESELASVLKRMEREGNSLSALMRQAWDGADLATLTKKPLRATGAHVGLVASVTPAEQEALMSETEAWNGWGNRQIFALVRRPHLLPHGGTLTDADLVPLAHELREVVLFARELGELERDREARAAWERIYPFLTTDRGGLYGAITARAAQQVIRLSLVYALLDRATEIRAAHLRAALAFWEAAEDSARQLFGGSLGNKIADAVLVEIQDAGPEGITRGELVDRFGRNVYGPQLKAALDLLARLKLAVGRKEHTGTRGRPAERWFSVSAMRRENEIDEGKAVRPSTGTDGITSSRSFSRHLSEKTTTAGGPQ